MFLCFISRGEACSLMKSYKVLEPAMNSRNYLDDLLVLVSELRDHLGDPVFNSFAEDLPKSIGKIRECQPKTLPVLSYFEAAVRSSPPASHALLEHLFRFREALFWGQTYSEADFGAKFLDSYGWTEFAGLRGPIPSESMACGVLLLGPNTEYPLHSHQAEETYVVLSGTASWKTGENDWAERKPLEIIYHQSWVPHAMQTGAEPLIAMYLWRGGDLKQKSTIVQALE